MHAGNQNLTVGWCSPVSPVRHEAVSASHVRARPKSASFGVPSASGIGGTGDSRATGDAVDARES